MGARFLLIDGYNLLHAAGLAQTSYRPNELRRQREKLLRLIARQLTPAELARATVIFDARDPAIDRPHRTRIAGLAVVFARPEGDADLVISRWLDQHPAPRHVTLVSGDRVLQRAARGVGAQWQESTDFWKELADRSRRRTPPAPEKPESLSAAEAGEWSRWFGTLDLSQLDAEPLPDSLQSNKPGGGAGLSSPPPATPQPTGSTPPAGRSSRRGGAQRSRRDDANAQSRPDVQTRRRPRGAGAEAPPPSAGPRSPELEHWLREFEHLQEWLTRETRQPNSMRDLEQWLREWEQESG